MKKKVKVKLIKIILAIFIFNNCSHLDNKLKPLIDEFKLQTYVEQFNKDD